MKILVVNAGSSTLKYKLFEGGETLLAAGRAERSAAKEGYWTTTPPAGGRALGGPGKTFQAADYGLVLERVFSDLLENRTVESVADLAGIGHRVVHGGEHFRKATLVDDTVIRAIRRNVPLAPLHNPVNLEGIEAARKFAPGIPQVAVFDTAFHRTIPPRAFLYAIPGVLYEKDGIRKYGFHGISHSFVSERAAAILGRPLSSLNMVTLHLGNGASMAAIEGGRCIDTSMGFSPLEGLVMGTRCGDVDPSLHQFLCRHKGMSPAEIDSMLNRESGLVGLCGSGDMRKVLRRERAGDEAAATALEVYVYRIRKYIGAYFAVLGKVDALVFTAGVGENSPEIRERCCSGIESLGVLLDREKNDGGKDGQRIISKERSPVKALVVPTDEELKIACETVKVLRENSRLE